MITAFFFMGDNDGDSKMVAYAYNFSATKHFISKYFFNGFAPKNAQGGGMHVIPTVTDLNGRGFASDIVSGHAYGRLMRVVNRGNVTHSYWTTDNDIFDHIDVNPGIFYDTGCTQPCSLDGTCKACCGAHPAFADLDNDTDIDLIIGDHMGKIHYYKNNGDKNTPDFKTDNPQTGTNDPFNSIDVGACAAPSFVDVDSM